MRAHPDNPHQDEKGEPRDGELDQFLAFERQKGLDARKDMSPDKVAEFEAADAHLAKKMA